MVPCLHGGATLQLEDFHRPCFFCDHLDLSSNTVQERQPEGTEALLFEEGCYALNKKDANRFKATNRRGEKKDYQ